MQPTDVPRIGVDEAREKVASGDAILVCAYEDEEQCRRYPLGGAITFGEFQARADTLPRNQPIVFY